MYLLGRYSCVTHIDIAGAQEVVQDSVHPVWATTFAVNYHFEQVQEVRLILGILSMLF
jgi:leucyl aminopeptidase